MVIEINCEEEIYQSSWNFMRGIVYSVCNADILYVEKHLSGKLVVVKHSFSIFIVRIIARKIINVVDEQILSIVSELNHVVIGVTEDTIIEHIYEVPDIIYKKVLILSFLVLDLVHCCVVCCVHRLVIIGCAEQDIYRVVSKPRVKVFVGFSQVLLIQADILYYLCFMDQQIMQSSQP